MYLDRDYRDMGSEKPVKKLTGIRHFFAAATYSFGGAKRLLGEAAFRHELGAFAVAMIAFVISGANLFQYVAMLVLFLLMIFLSPLSYLVPAYATAPALMYVGLLMLGNVTKLDFNDSVDALSGMLCAVFIVLTCNIVTGIMLGFVALVVGRLFAAEWKKLNIGTVIIALALVIFYAGGWAI